MKIIIGVDPSRKGYHEICMSNSNLERLYSVKKKGNQATIDEIKSLVAHARDTYDDLEIIIGIEYQDGTLLEKAMQVGVPVYAVAAGKVRKYIESQDSSGAKTDAIDAYGVCCYLAACQPKLEIYQPPSPLVRLASDIARQLKVIRQQSTKTWQRFWAITDRSCPELKCLLEQSAKSQWFLTMAAELFSSKHFKHTGPTAFVRYCRKRKSCMAEAELGKLLPMLKEIHCWGMPEVLALQAKNLLNLMAEEKVWVQQACQALEGWSQGGVALTIKGLGPKTLIRLLAYIGENWADTTPRKISAYSGVAPVVHASGTPPKDELARMHPKKRKRYEPKRFHRLACNRDLKTSLTLFAFVSLNSHPWARDAYDRFRARDQGHWEALRNLAMKWIRIIYAVIRDQQPYDVHYHQSNIARRNDPLVVH